jgi:hypothetical protein
MVHSFIYYPFTRFLFNLFSVLSQNRLKECDAMSPLGAREMNNGGSCLDQLARLRLAGSAYYPDGMSTGWVSVESMRASAFLRYVTRTIPG